MSKFTINDLLGGAIFSLSPELFLFFGVFVLSVVYYLTTLKKFSEFDPKQLIRSRIFYSFSLLTLFLYLFFIFCQVFENTTSPYFVFGGAFWVSPNTFFFKFIIGYLAFMVLSTNIASILDFTTTTNNNDESRVHAFETTALILFMLLGMSLCLQSNSLITFYLLLEFQSFCIFILLFLGKRTLGTVHAGVIYFLSVLVSSVLFLTGASYLYWRFGALDLNELWLLLYAAVQTSDYSQIDIFFFLMFISGLFVKVGLFPIHLWVPQVYGFGNIFAVSVLAVISKIFGFSIVLKFLSISELQFDIFFWIEFVALCAIFHGVFSALTQRSFLVLLGYSAIVHIGYMFLACSIDTPDGYVFATFYLLTYLINALPIFLFLLGVYNVDGRTKFSQIEDFSRIKLSNWKDITVFLMFSTFFFSFIGIPPFPGFFGKFFVIKYLILTGHYFSALIMGLFSVISAFYYLKIIRALFFVSELPHSKNTQVDDNSKNKNWEFDIPTSVAICIVLFGILNILFIFVSPYLLPVLCSIF